MYHSRLDLLAKAKNLAGFALSDFASTRAGDANTSRSLDSVNVVVFLLEWWIK